MKIAVALIHIFFATLWLGGSFFYAVLLLPRLRVLDAAGQRALRGSLRSAMTPLLAVSALATIVSGLVMMVQLRALHPGSFSHTRWGVALIVGTLASLAALAIAALCELRLKRQAALFAKAEQSGSSIHRESLLRLGALALLWSPWRPWRSRATADDERRDGRDTRTTFLAGPIHATCRRAPAARLGRGAMARGHELPSGARRTVHRATGAQRPFQLRDRAHRAAGDRTRCDQGPLHPSALRR